MPSSTPLSYQTTMPEYPDVSYGAYQAMLFGEQPGKEYQRPNRMATSLYGWMTGQPNYQTWRTNQLDDYNARMSAYNTWLSTGAGQKASAESGQYNPSYFQGSASASPLSYQDVDPGNGYSEMAQGISGILSFIQAFQGLRMASAQIRGLNLSNEKTAIENQYLAKYLERRSNLMGYKAEGQALRNAPELFSQYYELPELWKGGLTSPFGDMTYDLSRTQYGLSYQQAYQDVQLLKKAVQARKIQNRILRFNAKERKFYTSTVMQVQKELLDQQLSLMKGKVNFQPIEQKVWKRAQQWKVGTDVANTVISGIRLFLPGGAIGSGSGSSYSHGNMPWQSQSWNQGWDRATGEWYDVYDSFQ